MRFARTALAALVVMLAVSAAAAQTGGLTVQVVDSSGPLPGATVTISHETGYVKTTSLMTNAQGLAEFPVLRPGKGYVIEVEFPGFAKRHVGDIHIKINENQPLTVQLAAEIVERVKVTAETDVVDLEATAPSTKFSDEFIQDLPVPGRFYQNVLTLAPGVQDADGDGNPNVHGSRNRDFKAEVSGISNVDPLTGGFMSQVNPNSIEEMEVITAGAGVEFSRAQGGFARIIQKQGSNEFEGVFEFLYSSDILDGDGARDFSNLEDPGFDWLQPSLQVSGPLIKDKLWYRLSHELIDQDIPIVTNSGIGVTEAELGIHSDQLTWQVSPRNKLALQFQSDPLEVRNLGISTLRPVESSLWFKRAGETYQLSWTAPYSPKILIDTRMAWQDLNLEQGPTVAGVLNNCVRSPGFGFLEAAQCFDVERGEFSGSFGTILDDHRQRLTVRSDATVYGGRFWGMQHQFQFGAIVENERYFRYLNQGPRLNFFVYRPTGDATTGDETLDPIAIINSLVAIPQEANVRATGNTWGIYAEDQIKPLQNLTITLGARLDREEVYADGMRLFDPEAELSEFLRMQEEDLLPAETAMVRAFTAYEDLGDFVSQLAVTLNLPEFTVNQMLTNAARQSEFWQQSRRAGNQAISNTNLSPFLGVSWDPWSNGKTKFAVTARRYYDKIFLSVPLIELQPATTNIVFEATPSTQGAWNVTGVRNSISPAVNIRSVDRDLQTPYQDEFTFQFERELWAETSVRYTYVNRKFRDQLQDYDLNHVPGDFGRCRRGNTLDNSPLESSPGSGDTLIDAYTGVEYVDTDPGYGDGLMDDCVGEIEIPRGQDVDPDDPFSNENRVERPDGIPDLYVQNPGFGNIFWVSNLNLIDYEAHVFELIRRQYRSWEMQASYTWSEAKGDGEDFNQALGDDRSLLEDEKGYQSYDQRHVVKINATTITPWGFRLGGTVQWQSGLPYSLINREFAFDAVPPQFGNQGGGSARVRQTYETHRRNDQRNQSFWDIGLKFTKEMNLSRGLNVQISAEVFNLLNDGTFIVYNAQSESGQQVNGQNDGTYRFGRQWQVGFKLAF